MTNPHLSDLNGHVCLEGACAAADINTPGTFESSGLCR